MPDSHSDQSTQSPDQPFFRLPREFVRRAIRLRFGRGKNAMHNLPFVGPAPGKVGRSYWAVPKTGGAVGGWETGRALATIYLKYLYQLGQEEGGQEEAGHLQHIALDMFDGDYPVDMAQDARRGQACGFFSTLYPWLAIAARDFGHMLNDLDNKVLLEAANAGLNFDSEAYEASLSDE